tara:strand:- start:83 stop:385 length:303 start_codon:yes stop_codon:yes gene_type:complete
MTDKQVNEASENAVKAAGDFCKKFAITSGLTGKQHAGAMVHALVDHGLLQQLGTEEENKAERQLAFVVLLALENGSALRQKLEKLEVLKAGAIAAASDYT